MKILVELNPFKRQKLIQVQATCHTTITRKHSAILWEKKRKQTECSDIYDHVTSVDGFNDLKRRKYVFCPPDPGHSRSQHSAQDQTTLCWYCATHTQQEGRNISQQEKARNKVSLLAVCLSCVSQSGRDSSGTLAFQVDEDLPRELSGGQKKKKRKHIHFATQASREQARRRWRRRPTAVTVWESKQAPRVRDLSKLSWSDLRRITK